MLRRGKVCLFPAFFCPLPIITNGLFVPLGVRTDRMTRLPLTVQFAFLIKKGSG